MDELEKRHELLSKTMSLNVIKDMMLYEKRIV